MHIYDLAAVHDTAQQIPNKNIEIYIFIAQMHSFVLDYLNEKAFSVIRLEKKIVSSSAIGKMARSVN